MILRKMEGDPIPHTTVSAPAQLVGKRGRIDAQPATNTAPPYLFLKGREKHHLLSEGDVERHHRGKVTLKKKYFILSLL